LVIVIGHFADSFLACNLSLFIFSTLHSLWS